MHSGQFSKADNGNDSNFDSSEISTIWRFSHPENAFSHIFETFDGIKISSIFVLQNALFPIVCKLEFGEIKTFRRFSHPENAFSHIYVAFDGIKI